jgi:small-conductance mechanosensitive channel
MSRSVLGWFLTIMLVVALPCGVAAADAASAPTNLSRSDFDAVVAATKEAVQKELPAKAAVTAVDAEQNDPAVPNLTHLLENDAGLLSQRIADILAALPSLPADLAQLGARIEQSGPAGRTIGQWVLLTLISLMVMLATMVGLPRLLARPRQSLLGAVPQRAGPAQLAGIFLLDVVVVLAVLLLAYTEIEVFFSDHQLQSRIAAGLIGAVAVWRLALLPVDLFLRPGEPMARLLPFGDGPAAAGRRFCSVLLLVIAILVEGIGTHYGTSMPTPHAQLIGLFWGPVVATMLLVGIRQARVIVAAAIAGGGTAIHIRLAPIWHWLAIAVVLMLLVAWFVGTLVLNLVVFQTLLGSLVILALALVLDYFLAYLSVQLFKSTAPGEAASVRGGSAALLRRCARVGLWSLVAIALIEAWAIDLARLIEPEQWKRLAGAILTAGITLYVAFVVWQLISFHIDRAIRNSPAATAFDPADPHTGSPPKVGTRLRTMLPLLRIVLLVAVAVLAVLVVLSELGVNTAPLIAGASVFGLAISFGSQALVKDVVSGIFYMADDAFRVGEYIDTGKLKGTVEGMTVRSLKVRHQNGPLHTIPFGELASVTNYSRHFATMKFAIRLVRDVDLELVRKTVKRVGLEMMEDPELQPEMILPLKFQGIVDVDQTAVVCRLKFTCKPQKPTWVQRAALKRLYLEFRKHGIEFAGPTTVQAQIPPAAVALPLGPAGPGAARAVTVFDAKPPAG